MKIVIPGKPIPLKRHRHTRNGFTYNPQSKLMSKLRNIISLQFNREPYNIPLHVEFIFYMAIPKMSKAKTLQLIGTPHFKKPDISNILKFYEDSFNSFIWKDDALIYKVTAQKIYDLSPRTEIHIFPFSGLLI